MGGGNETFYFCSYLSFIACAALIHTFTDEWMNNEWRVVVFVIFLLFINILFILSMVLCLVHLSSNVFWLCSVPQRRNAFVWVSMFHVLLFHFIILGHFDKRLPYIEQKGECNLNAVGRIHLHCDIIDSRVELFALLRFPILVRHSLSNVCRFFFNNSRVFVYKYATKMVLMPLHIRTKWNSYELLFGRTNATIVINWEYMAHRRK